ncbi:MAG: DUF308 domain-containing protein [Erysipelothrix sp.]
MNTQYEVGHVSLWKKIIYICTGLVYTVLGFLMIQHPATTLSTLSFAMGWTVTIMGILATLSSFKNRENDEVRSGSFLEGICLLLLGLMFLFGDFINNTLVLSYLLVFWIIVDSAVQLQYVVHFQKGWSRIVMIILDVLLIVYGASLLFNPQEAESFLVLWIGIGFIGTGVGKVIKSV